MRNEADRENAMCVVVVVVVAGKGGGGETR